MNLEIEVHNTAEVLKAKKVTTYSEQPGQFLEQLLIVPDLRLHIYYCTYIHQKRFAPRPASAGYPCSQGNNTTKQCE